MEVKLREMGRGFNCDCEVIHETVYSELRVVDEVGGREGIASEVLKVP